MTSIDHISNVHFPTVIIYGDYFSNSHNFSICLLPMVIFLYWFQWNFLVIMMHHRMVQSSFCGFLKYVCECDARVSLSFLKEHDKVSRGLWVLNNSNLLSCIKECDSTKKKKKLTNHEIFTTFSTLAISYNIHFVTYSSSKKQLTQLIPIAIWKVVYQDSQKTYLGSFLLFLTSKN
jgi:hypothetical protein